MKALTHKDLKEVIATVEGCWTTEEAKSKLEAVGVRVVKMTGLSITVEVKLSDVTVGEKQIWPEQAGDKYGWNHKV